MWRVSNGSLITAASALGAGDTPKRRPASGATPAPPSSIALLGEVFIWAPNGRAHSCQDPPVG